MKNKFVGKASITINAPATKVWEALTKPEIIKQYFFGTNTKSTWKPGSPITFSGEWQGKKYSDKGTVLDIVPNKILKYSYWSSMSGIEDKPENYVIITNELFENDGKTNLHIIQENIPDEKTKEHSEGNWKIVLEGLKNVVEK
jgi:uncharacterized protein YndB with AHSA1/START domain